MSSQSEEYLSTDDMTETVSSDEILEHSDNIDFTGKILKKYNIVCELGRGSYSIVWLAYNISDSKFYALKVQDPSEFKDGLSEIKFVQKLPINPPIFNNIIEYFIENIDQKKYLCSVWNLHCSNLDSIIRKSSYQNGLPLDKVKKIMKNLIESLRILHTKYKVFHGDIKTDNILVKGINDKDKFLIQAYKNEKFDEKYINQKHDFWTSKGNKLEDINKMKIEDKLVIRKQIHNDITTKILEEYELSNISKYSIDSKYLEEMNTSLADFGTHCEEHNYYEESFGTRYYQAPEIILMGKCSYPVDIWALGCTFYELLSGKILFDPIKDSNYSRDYYHLCLINETCGNFDKNFIKKTTYYKRFFDYRYNIKEYIKPNENRLDRKINELNLSDQDKKVVKELLSIMLTIDDKRRVTIDKLCTHNYFST